MTMLSAPPPKDNKFQWQPHPAGTFVAVLCDVHQYITPNPNFGKPRPGSGEIDTFAELSKIVLSFLTAETIDINGETLPRYTSFIANASWAEKSKLRQTVAKWQPQFATRLTVNLDELIGTPAMVTVATYKKKDGGTGSNVDTIAPLMRGVEHLVPSIANYVRKKDRPVKDAPAVTNDAPAVTNDAPTSYSFTYTNNLPF